MFGEVTQNANGTPTYPNCCGRATRRRRANGHSTQRVRGSRVPGDVPRTAGQRPADAGMPPAGWRSSQSTTRAPRIRGDGPSISSNGPASSGCAPPTRGWVLPPAVVEAREVAPCTRGDESFGSKVAARTGAGTCARGRSTLVVVPIAPAEPVTGAAFLVGCVRNRCRVLRDSWLACVLLWCVQLWMGASERSPHP